MRSFPGGIVQIAVYRDSRKRAACYGFMEDGAFSRFLEGGAFSRFLEAGGLPRFYGRRRLLWIYENGRFSGGRKAAVFLKCMKDV